MSRVAIAVWNKRVSPVFDVSRKIYLCDITAEGIARQVEKQLPEDNPLHKVACLRDLGVETLICGAISRSLAEMLVAWNIHLLPFTTGDVQGVLNAFAGGRLPSADYTMPGCCRRYQTRQGEPVATQFGPLGRRTRRGNAARGRRGATRPAQQPHKGGPHAPRG